MIPEHLSAQCALCPTQEVGLEAIVGHLEEVHGLTAERWPDGGLVIDASDTPELMEER